MTLPQKDALPLCSLLFPRNAWEFTLPQDGTWITHQCVWNIVMEGMNVSGVVGEEGCRLAPFQHQLSTLMGCLQFISFLMLTA